MVLYEWNVLLFQMEVGWCTDRLGCVKRVLYHGWLNEKTFVVKKM